MRLKLVESVEELFELFTSVANLNDHWEKHVTKNYIDFFDHVLDPILDPENHTDILPRMEPYEYTRFANALQYNNSAEGFVMKSPDDKDKRLCYMKRRKLKYAGILSFIEGLRDKYFKECAANNKSFAEARDQFVRVINALRDNYYEVVFFNIKDNKKLGEQNVLKSISYYITINLPYLDKRRVDELPVKYGVDYFRLESDTTPQTYKEQILKEIEKKQTSSVL